MAEEEQQPTQHNPKSRLIWLLAAALIIVGAGSYLYSRHIKSPVPNDVQKAVSFRIYYPQQGKMPTGYHLDKTSFRLAQTGVVLFSVSYDNGRSMVFSEEAKPTGDVIDKFNSSAIPVHTQVNTALGKALIGAYGSGKDLRTLATLPINDGPWLIVTAASDVNQSDLGKVLGSLTK